MEIEPIPLILGIFAGLFIILFFWLVLSVVNSTKKINQTLSNLTPLINGLQENSARINETLETVKVSLEHLNRLIDELQIVPRVVSEIGESIKDFEGFLKNQVETVKDDLHFTLAETKEVISDLKAVTSETRKRAETLTQSIDPLIRSVKETVDTTNLLLSTYNQKFKGLYVEVSALTAGAKEIIWGIKRLFGKKQS